MEHRRVYPFCGQQLCCLQHTERLHARSDQPNVLSLTQEDGAAELETMIGRKDRRARIPSETEINRLGHLHHRVHGPAKLHRIGGRNRDDARHGAEDGEILDSLVRFSCLAGEDAAIAPAELDVQPGLGHDDANLIQSPLGEKGGEGADPGDIADGGQPGSDADHVLLRDAHLQEAVRVRGGEDIGASGVGKITIKDQQVGITVGEVHEAFAPSLAHGHRVTHAYGGNKCGRVDHLTPPGLDGRPWRSTRPGPVAARRRSAPWRAS